jgi:hypothetical protein
MVYTISRSVLKTKKQQKNILLYLCIVMELNIKLYICGIVNRHMQNKLVERIYIILFVHIILNYIKSENDRNLLGLK